MTPPRDTDEELIDYLEFEACAADDHIMKIEAENDGLRGQVHALKARVEALTEALEPFADAADAYPISTPDQTSIDDKHVNISVGALRRARELVDGGD